MRLFKRPSKPQKGRKQYYYARVNIDGKDTWISSKCEVGKRLKREAEEKILEIVKERKAGRKKSNILYLPPTKGGATRRASSVRTGPLFEPHAPIYEVAKEFINLKKLNNMYGWRSNLSTLNQFMKFAGSETSIRDINVGVINRFKEYRKQTCKNTTVNLDLALLHKFFEDAKRLWNLYDGPNPVAQAGRITIKEENQSERIEFTDEDIAVLRSAAPGYFLDWINLALKTAAREVELWKAHESHVHFKEQNIWIPPSKTLRGRYIALGPDGMDLVNRLIKQSPDGFLLHNQTGQRFVIPGRVSTVFGRLRDRAGLQHGTFHCLRHTAASRMLRAGEPLDKVQYILGHKNILTTRIYIHSSEDSQKAALALDNL